jgi:type II secretory ATPase GspE/PulE/Tfp pilus assembly ATPase PilB-like protein
LTPARPTRENVRVKRFGDLLVERGLITGDQLRQALSLQHHLGKRLGQVLIEMGALSVDQFNWALSELLGIPYVDLTEDMVDLELARTLPEDVLRRHQAFPVLRSADEMTVVLADPTDHEAVAELEALARLTVRPAMAARETVAKLLDKAFPFEMSRRARDRHVDIGPELAAGVADPVYTLLSGALRDDASEVHVEPLPREGRVRVRMEFGLDERASLAQGALAPILARLRSLAGLPGQAGHGQPVQGGLRARVDDREVELDLLLYPTLHGEAAVITLWPRPEGAPTYASMGLPPAAQDALGALVAPRRGLVLVAGAARRARGALLYALARAESSPAKKTLVLERRVSFVVPDFVQVEIPGDFGGGVATILGQHADVVVVEDVGSAPPCRAAFRAAERGALVLAGVDVTSAGAALGQVLSLDVPRAALLSVTRGVAEVRRAGAQYAVEVLAMTDERRREWSGRVDGHL